MINPTAKTMLRTICLLSLIVVPGFPVTKRPVPARSVGYKIGSADSAWVKRKLSRMTLKDKVGQLIGVRVSGKFYNRQSPDFLDLKKEVELNHVGCAILFAGNVYESAVLLNQLQKLSSLPLIVSADFERGVSFRIADTTSFPWTMAIGATGSEEFAYQEGATTAREARALGVHWIFAPVMDVNNNPGNPVINIRSFGEDPHLVARLGSAFIRGARDNGVLTTAKHFPGHGDTATDTHIGLAVVPSDLARLNSIELVPFKAAILAGVDSIMSAHVAVPQVTGEPGMPATLSSKVLTGLLRETIGFKGLIVTDAMEMGGITTRFWTGQAAVRALQAGADMLLLPPDTNVAIQEVVRAVKRGDLSEERINQSVRRVLEAKTKLGLHKQRLINLDRIADLIAAPADQKLAQEMADRSITLLKNDGPLVPLDPLRSQNIFSVVLSSDLDAAPGNIFQSELRRRFPSIRAAAIDPRTPGETVSNVIRTASEADVIICSTLVRVISGKGNVALPENQRLVIDRLIASGKPVLWLAFGNPYLLNLYPQVAAYLCTFSYADVSQIAAARAVSGEIPVVGKTPVSIPGYAGVGDGLQLPKLDMTLHVRPPETAGLSQAAFEEVQKLLESYVEAKAFPGAALVVGYKGAIVLDTAAGRLDYTANSPRVNGDTIYDLASLSKAIGTTAAAMMLVESGRLLLTAPVQDYLPEFSGPNKEKVQVQHLLLHCTGLPAFQAFYQQNRGYDQMLNAVYATPLEFEPGERTLYSDLGMILLGEIISRVSGQPLDRILSDRLFGPLGMKSTTYNPPKAWRSRIAPTENDPWRKRIVRGEVHDENAFAMGGVAGHAGLFSTAHDLAVFAQTILNRGLYDYRRYWAADTIAKFTLPEGVPEKSRALGWGKPSASQWSGAIFSPAAIGHTGFTGTSIWIDPQKKFFMVLLTNRVHPTRKNLQIDEARQKITESIVRALP
jgi:beta-N-acetylhexosaminidase